LIVLDGSFTEFVILMNFEQEGHLTNKLVIFSRRAELKKIGYL